jgi:hypothetical protein
VLQIFVLKNRQKFYQSKVLFKNPRFLLRIISASSQKPGFWILLWMPGAKAEKKDLKREAN